MRDEPIKRRNCLNWSWDHCARHGGICCPEKCDEYRPYCNCGDFAKLLKTVDLRFDICQDIEQVLKIGRDYQNKDGYRGAHYDTVKLLCDTIEYLRDKLPKPVPDWKAICAKCKDGDIEPKHCKYYGEPNGCNSPIYGEHPTAEKSSAVGDAAKLRESLVQCELFLGYVSRHGHPTLNPGDECTACRDADELRGMVVRALSAQPRNCDMPLVVDGPADNNADKAWLAFKRHNPDAYFDVSGLLRCIDWLLTPATKGGAK